MEKILQIYIQFSFILGIVLIVAPTAYLLYMAIVDTNVAAFDPSLEKEVLVSEIEEDLDNEIIKRDSEVTALINQLKAEKTGNLVPSYFDTQTSNSVTTHGFTLKIPSVGIDTIIYESYNSEEALKQGVWRKPEYGAPDRREQPTVLAAHRWGYDTDTWAHREKNLFLNLPNVVVGDEITINWNNTEYTYKVASTETNTYVSRLSDLILFTCEDYFSPNRVFVYADLVETK